MLQDVPSQRWTIQEALEHTFFHEAQENINAKGDSLEQEEGVEAKEGGDSEVQTKEGKPVPAADERKKESVVIAVQEEEGEGEKVEESDVRKKTEVDE